MYIYKHLKKKKSASYKQTKKKKKMMFGPEITQQLQRLERQIADMECRSLTSETETIEQLRTDLEIKQLEIDRNIKEMNQIRQDRDTFRSEVTVLSAQIELLKDKLERVERERDDAIKNLEPTKMRMTEDAVAFERERESLEQAVLELRRENEELKEENAMLKEINREKFSNNNSTAPLQEQRQNLMNTQQPNNRADFGVVPKKVGQTLEARFERRIQQQRAAPPPTLTTTALAKQQNSIRQQTPHVPVPSNLQSATVAIAPSPWEAFAVLRNALDAEERKLKPFVPSSAASHQSEKKHSTTSSRNG
jgi:cell division protein FtsB